MGILVFRFLFSYSHPGQSTKRFDRPEDEMDQKALFLKFWEKEGPTTRKVLDRIPEGSDYRPDPKSRTAREIAWLIVREQIALVEGLERGEIRWAEPPTPATIAEVLALDDQH